MRALREEAESVKVQMNDECDCAGEDPQTHQKRIFSRERAFMRESPHTGRKRPLRRGPAHTPEEGVLTGKEDLCERARTREEIPPYKE
jgi:hypothetical protein